MSLRVLFYSQFLLCVAVWWFAMESLCSSSISSRLKAVSMVTRHGDRTPFFSYPLDPHRDYNWPGGRGALTPKGAGQLSLSGAQKALRYSSLLQSIPEENTSLITNRINVISSNSGRCINSAINFLESFSPVPFPRNFISTTPVELDEILAYGKPCPNYGLTLNNGPDFNDTDIRAFTDMKTKSGTSLISWIEKKTGSNMKSLITFLLLVDTLKVERENGFSLPDWVREINPDYLRDFCKTIFYKLSSSRYMEIHTGGLLRSMIEGLDRFLVGASDQNILFYSGHDLTVSSLLYAFGRYDKNSTIPLYGATISLELAENSFISNDLEVKVFYFRDFEDISPLNIPVPNCREPCPYRRFKEIMKPKFIYDYDEACNK